MPAALSSRGTLMQHRAASKSQRTGLQPADGAPRASREQAARAGMRTGGRALARPAASGGGAMLEASGLKRMHMGPARLRREL